jgi:hypothetical protein
VEGLHYFSINNVNQSCQQQAPTLGNEEEEPESTTSSPTSTEAPTASTTPNVYITEIASPVNNKGSRYVELYSSTGASLTGVHLVRWANNDGASLLSGERLPASTLSDIDLGGESIAPGGFMIICRDNASFSHTFTDVACDKDGGENGAADSDGDDQIAIVFLTKSAITDDVVTISHHDDRTVNEDIEQGNYVVIDMFGAPAEDGTSASNGHELGFGRVQRSKGAPGPKAIWDSADWVIETEEIDSADAKVAPQDFDPKAWIGVEGPAPHEPTLQPTEPATPVSPTDPSESGVGTVVKKISEDDVVPEAVQDSMMKKALSLGWQAAGVGALVLVVLLGIIWSCNNRNASSTEGDMAVDDDDLPDMDPNPPVMSAVRTNATSSTHQSGRDASKSSFQLPAALQMPTRPEL